jgi:hypothetical protein
MSTEGKEKTFTQAEIDAMIATAVAEAKNPFASVDLQEYKTLKEEAAKKAEEELKKKGQYEQLIANTVKEKDDALAKLKKESDDRFAELSQRLERSEVDGKLLSVATSQKALKPEQVAALLRSSIKYDAKTGVSVVDAQGNIVSKNGKPVTVEEHVTAFLEANPHFLPAGPGGSGSQGSGGDGSKNPFKITRADAKDPSKYRTAREAAEKAGGNIEIVG